MSLVVLYFVVAVVATGFSGMAMLLMSSGIILLVIVGLICCRGVCSGEEGWFGLSMSSLFYVIKSFA